MSSLVLLERGNYGQVFSFIFQIFYKEIILIMGEIYMLMTFLN